MDRQKQVDFFKHLCEMYEDTNTTFQLVKKYVDWGQKTWGDKPVPEVDRIDYLVVGKLKEYLIVQLQSLLGVENLKSKEQTVSLIYLLDSDHKKLFMEKYADLYKAINILRNKRLAHFDLEANSPKIKNDKEESNIQSDIDEIREWLPNDCILSLMRDIIKWMCWYAKKYSLPDPSILKHSYFEFEIDKWLEKK